MSLYDDVYVAEIKERAHDNGYWAGYEDGLKAARPIPDTDTGLVPCGCGGELEVEEGDNGKFFVACLATQCFLSVGRSHLEPYAFDGLYDTREEAIDAANRAMGYTP